jgi:hypothetical protein
MRQKLLFFISILALNFSPIILAEEGQPELLPALPVSDIAKENKDSKDQISFMEKVMDFFGFSKEEKKEADNSKAEVIDEGQKEPEKVPAAEVVGDKSQTENVNLPPELAGSTEEGPVVNHPIFSSSRAAVEDVSDTAQPSPAESEPADIAKKENGEVTTAPDSAASKDTENLPALQNLEPTQIVPDAEKPHGATNVPIKEGISEEKNNVPNVAPLTPPPAVDSKQDLSLPEGFDDFGDDQKNKDAVGVPPVSEVVEDKNKLVSPVNSEQTKQPDAAGDVKAHGEVKLESGASVPVEAILIENPQEELSVPEDNSKDQVPENGDKDGGISQVLKPDDSSAASQKSVKVEAQNDDKIKLEVPNYVSEVNNKSVIDKYKKELDSRKINPQQPPKITDKELASGDNKISKFTEVAAADLNSDVLDFVNNESQVLLLPDDDVVAGQLTEAAKMNMMDFRSYLKLFWANYDKIERECQNQKMETFIDEYELERRVDYSEEDVDASLVAAFKAIDSDNINDLIALLNSYPILQMTGDGENTLLHQAAYVGNYHAAKLLVLKGIDIYAKNAKNQTAMGVAKRYKNKDIVFLLKSAGFKNT